MHSLDYVLFGANATPFGLAFNIGPDSDVSRGDEEKSMQHWA